MIAKGTIAWKRKGALVDGDNHRNRPIIGCSYLILLSRYGGRQFMVAPSQNELTGWTAESATTLAIDAIHTG